jgi:ubiquinol-cytochrome c reductase cytochrome c subunit
MDAAAMRNTFVIIVAGLLIGSGPALAASAENGKKAFVKNGCWQCHGFEGQGSIASSGGKVIAHTALPEESFEAFVRGTDGAMPPFSEKILSSADLADIYAYLQSVPKPQDVKDIPLLK